MHRASSMTLAMRSDSPKSTRSAPWPAHHHGSKKISYTAPSPRSVRSDGVGGSSGDTRERKRDRERSHDRKRSGSAESHSSMESKSHRRYQ